MMAESQEHAPKRTVSIRLGLCAALAALSLAQLLLYWGVSEWKAAQEAPVHAAGVLDARLDGIELRLHQALQPALENLNGWRDGLTRGLTNPLEDSTQATMAMAWFNRYPALTAVQLVAANGREWALFRDETAWHEFHGAGQPIPWSHYTSKGAPLPSLPDFKETDWKTLAGEGMQLDWTRAVKAALTDEKRNAWQAAIVTDFPGGKGDCLRISGLAPWTGGPAIMSVCVRIEAQTWFGGGTAGDAVVFSEDSAQTILASSVVTVEGETQAAFALRGFARALSQHADGPRLPYAIAADDEWHRWWYRFRYCEFAGGLRLGCGARLSNTALLQPEDGILLFCILPALGLALLVAAALSRAYSRPLRALTERLRALEQPSGERGTWPGTRVAEIARLAEACKNVTRQIDRRIRELARTQSFEPPRRHGELHSGHMAALAEEFVSVRAGEQDAQAESVAESRAHAQVIPESTTIAAAPGGFSEPPKAFVQAMQSTRRQLGAAELKMQALAGEYEALAERVRANDQRLFAQRKALGMLAREFAGNATKAQEVFERLAEMGVRALNVHAASLWVANYEQDTLSCVSRYDRVAQRHTQGGTLRRGECPVFFIAAESQDVLRVRDTQADPRAPRLPMPDATSPSPEALLLAPVCLHARLFGVVCLEHVGGPRMWTVDEENFAIALSQFASRPMMAVLAESAEERPAAHGQGTGRVLPAIEMHEEAPLYRWVLDSAGWIVWALNATGHITYANLAAEEAYGCDAMEMLGRTISSFAAESARQTDMQALRRVMAGQETCIYETEHTGAGGNTLQLRVTLSLLQDETGAEMGAVGIAENITEARRKERALNERLAHYRRLIDNAPEAVWSVDAIGCITFVNAAAEKIYGYATLELVGKSLAMLGQEESGQRDLDRLYRLLAGETCTGYRTTHRAKNGALLDMYILAEARRDDRGRIDGATGIALPMPEA